MLADRNKYVPKDESHEAQVSAFEMLNDPQAVASEAIRQEQDRRASKITLLWTRVALGSWRAMMTSGPMMAIYNYVQYSIFKMSFIHWAY